MVQSGHYFGVSVRGGDADVVYQSVEPDIGDVIGIEGDGDAPVEARDRAGDAKVLQDIVLEQSEDFIAAALRINKRRIIFEMINQPRLAVLELKVIIFLLQLDDLTVGWIEGAVRSAIPVGEKRLFPCRVEAFVKVFVKTSFRVEFREEALDDGFMARLGGAHT